MNTLQLAASRKKNYQRKNRITQEMYYSDLTVQQGCAKLGNSGAGSARGPTIPPLLSLPTSPPVTVTALAVPLFVSISPKLR